MPIEKLALLGGHARIARGSVPTDFATLTDEGLEAVEETLRSGRWSMFNSPEVEAFEEEFANYVGADYVVMVNSCTTAILAALRASGVESDDRVAVPAYTYVGSCLPLIEIGARPVWVDVSAATPNMDAAGLHAAFISGELAAVVIPLLFGSSLGIDETISACVDSRTSLIFDCAQFLGDRETTARLVEIGICCFSFGDSKLLRIGEGGAVATNSCAIADRVRRFRHEGESWLDQDVSRLALESVAPLAVLESLGSAQRGLNLRPLAYAATVGRAQLIEMPNFLEMTHRNANEFDRAIGSEVLIKKPHSRKIWWSYPCVVQKPLERNTLLAALLAEGIPVGVHFPRLLPQHPIFGGDLSTSLAGIFPNATNFAEQHLVFPIYPAIEPETARSIGEVMLDVLEDPSLHSEAARSAGQKLLQDARLSDLSSGLYMFLVDS